MAKTLKINRKLVFRSSKELSNGQTQLQYHEEIKGEAGATGQFTIPTSITLGLRVFKGMTAYEVEARFRYRVSDDGELTFSYHINNLDRINEDAFTTVIKQIETGCTAFSIFKE